MQKFITNYNLEWELNHGHNLDIIIYENLTEDYGFAGFFSDKLGKLM